MKTLVKIEYKQHGDINLVMWKCSGLPRVRMRIFLSVFMNDSWRRSESPSPLLSSSLQSVRKGSGVSAAAAVMYNKYLIRWRVSAVSAGAAARYPPDISNVSP